MWLFSRNRDLGLVFLPVWLLLAFAFFLPDNILYAEVPLWLWVVAILMLDVGHVWSTLFRVYLHKDVRSAYGSSLILLPLSVFIGAFLIFSCSIHLFWSMMAYLAVFHFIKQQAGFLMLYKRRNGDLNFDKLDKIVLYGTTLIPMIIWHFSSKRNFEWFVEGDFFTVNLESYYVHQILTVILLISLLYWVYKRWSSVSLPVALWIFTTALNWYLPIAYFNSDIVFSVTNVVAHGIPYFLLVTLYQNKKVNKGFYKTLILVVSVSVFFATMEELGWDLFVNKEKFFPNMGANFSSDILVTIVVAILTVPQVTHYVLDGWVWKRSEKNEDLKNLFTNE